MAYNFYGSTSNEPNVSTDYGPAYSTPSGQYYVTAQTSQVPKQALGAATTSGGGGGASTDPGLDLSGFNAGPSPNDSLGGGPSEQDVINNEFNQFNALLDQETGTANKNFSETKGLYDTQFANASGQLKTEKTDQTRDIKGKETLDLKRVRQLLSDLSQRDAARTAIRGGGSVTEALAERFGRTAQSKLGNIQEQTRSALNRVNTFYNNSITKLQENYDAAIVGARQTLDANLAEIRRARTGAASAKQRASLDAWRSYYDNVNQAKIQAATFKAQYDLWKQGQDNQLAATGGFNLSNLNTLNQGTASSFNPLTSTPVSEASTGNINKNFQLQPQNSEDEFLKQLGLTGAAAVQNYAQQ